MTTSNVFLTIKPKTQPRQPTVRDLVEGIPFMLFSHGGYYIKVALPWVQGIGAGTGVPCINFDDGTIAYLNPDREVFRVFTHITLE